MENKITLANLRAENHMSQRDLAKKINTSSGTIGMYETGKRTPPLKRAIAIAELFNVPVEKIEFSKVERKMCVDDTNATN